jgi:hypothetical protein
MDSTGLERLEGSKSLFLIPLGIGVIALVAGAFMTESRHFMFAYIASFAFVLSIVLGCLFFVLVQHLTRAGWSVTVRRVAEAVAMTFPLLFLLFLPIAYNIAMGKADVYPWAKNVDWKQVAKEEEEADKKADNAASNELDKVSDAAKIDAGEKAEVKVEDRNASATLAQKLFGSIAPHMAKKAKWLNITMFLGRWALYFALWTGISWYFWSSSVKQDETGDPAITARLQSVAPVCTIIFALSLTFGAWDLIMSLDPVWYSTMYGVYFFAGAMGSSYSVLILSMFILQRCGYLKHRFNKEHYHDLGKFLFGFTIFWAYIAFSQFMLIWYSNLPEETFWFVLRGASTNPGHFNTWAWVAIIMIFFRFVIPFLGLLSRHVKRKPPALAFWAVWILVFQWIDYWWQVMPEYSPNAIFGLTEMITLVGLVAAVMGGVMFNLTRANLLPVKDPRLPESIAFTNI